MPRIRSILFLSLLLAGAAAAIALAVQKHRPPRRGLSALLAGKNARPAVYLFTPSSTGPLIVVPPDTWYSFGNSLGQQAAGDFSTGRCKWLGAPQLAAELPARGDGVIFDPVPASRRTPAAIRVIDEASRAQVRSITPPVPTSKVYWCDGRIVGVGATVVYALDASTDRLLWTFDTQAYAIAGVTIADGAIYVGAQVEIDKTAPPSHASRLMAVDARDGRLIWKRKMPLPLVGAPAVDGDSVYCVLRSHGFADSAVAFDAKSGWWKWISRAVAEPGPDPAVRIDPHPLNVAAPAVADGVLCIPIGNRLLGLSTSTGRLNWRSEPLGITNELSPPLIRDGIAFVTTYGGACALDCKTGRTVWKFTNSVSWRGTNPNADLAPQIAGNVLLAAYQSGAVDVIRLPLPPISFPPSQAWPIRSVTVWIIGAFSILAVGGAAIQRRLKATIALFSLLLCAMTVCGWIFSHRAAYFFGTKHFNAAGRMIAESARGITSSRGALTLGTTHLVRETSIRPRIQGDSTSVFWYTRRSPQVLANGVCLEDFPADPDLTHFSWRRFSRPSGTTLGNQSETSLTVPHWFVAAVLAVAPFAWLSGRWRDRRRYPKGHCKSCGYDLRASAERCPECGKPIPASTIEKSG